MSEPKDSKLLSFEDLPEQEQKLLKALHAIAEFLEETGQEKTNGIVRGFKYSFEKLAPPKLDRH